MLTYSEENASSLILKPLIRVGNNVFVVTKKSHHVS